jgi:hypothetical protein
MGGKFNFHNKIQYVENPVGTLIIYKEKVAIVYFAPV